MSLTKKLSKVRGQYKGNAQKSDIRDVYDCGGDCAHLRIIPDKALLAGE